MLPKKVKKRASLLAITLLISVTGIFFILQSLNKNILYFKSPTDIRNNQNINFDKKIRVGGMVKKNSLIIKEEEIKTKRRWKSCKRYYIVFNLRFLVTLISMTLIYIQYEL